MWKNYVTIARIEEALPILNERQECARIMAGATDLILEMERGVRKGIDTLIDITRIPGLNTISLDPDGLIHLGPLVTHNDCIESSIIVERAFPLARAAWEVGAPQIRNRGTIAGNLITASPANDTIPPLMAMGAEVILRSVQGERQVPLKDFYTGVRKTVMRPNEMLVDIRFPALRPNQRGTFLKLGLRRAQAISLVDLAVVLSYSGEQVEDAAITLGAVASTIIHAVQAEEYLRGQPLDAGVIDAVSHLAAEEAQPISDVRSSGDYRAEMVRVCTKRALETLAAGTERKDYPVHPVLLWGERREREPFLIKDSIQYDGNSPPIVTRINGEEYRFTSGHHKTLLRLLREEARLTGTKEGCAEGECGACTVFLDGLAVMSCLVPAPRAHGAEIVTIEGIPSQTAQFSSGEQEPGTLHPVQQAFIDEGAVQCGYCIPGFIMSGVKLLEERPHPTREEIQQAITGNLCRCTGYYKIIQAIERPSLQEVQNG
jgi:xanthine dehydrogenase iron-sulfur cluster and FAD-binding subunit A